MLKRLPISTVKRLACCYFLLVGLIAVVMSVWSSGFSFTRDALIVFFLGLPTLINKKSFHLLYGLMTGLVLLTWFLAYIIGNNPWHADISFGMFVLGFVILGLGLASSLGLIYAATHSKAKNTFTLI